MNNGIRYAAYHDLVEPITVDGVQQTRIGLRRVKGHDIESIEGMPEGSKQTFLLIQRLSGWPPEAVRDLDGADIEAIAETIEGFLPKSKRSRAGK